MGFSKNATEFIVVVLLLQFAPTTGLATSDYQELVDLFFEFRDYQEAVIVDGVPDYTAEGMARQFAGLHTFRDRLFRIDTSGWPLWQQVDYHLVRGEMNALEYFHKVHRPWSRDPGFYSIMGGDAGAVMQAEDLFEPLTSVAEPMLIALRTGEKTQDASFSFSKGEVLGLRTALGSLPKLYDQARENLTEATKDFAEFAVRNFELEIGLYELMSQKLRADYPDIAADAGKASQAVRQYVIWLDENANEMIAQSGTGKSNYDWWLRNVQFSPWGWEDNNRIIQHEYNRSITFLKLEEHRNRNLPPLDVAMSERAYHASLRQAMEFVTDFLRDEEIMTIHDWVDPRDYYLHGRGTPVPLEYLDDSVGERFLPENSDVDLKYRQREILPGETHEYIGHMLDDMRHERQNKSPIRSAGRRYNMASMRLEGWAVSLEELLAVAGVLDERPRRGREMLYMMMASHSSLSIPDLKMHARQIDLTEARQLVEEITPRGWSKAEEDVVYFEMQSNLRNPGGFHSNVVTGKAYFMKMFRERAQELDTEFVIRDFIDEFLGSGLIPLPLIRWEMTGDSSELALVTEPLERWEP